MAGMLDTFVQDSQRALVLHMLLCADLFVLETSKQPLDACFAPPMLETKHSESRSKRSFPSILELEWYNTIQA